LSKGTPEFGKSAKCSIWLEEISVPHELSVLALVKGRERYIYVYDDTSREDLIQVLRDQASSPDCSLSWFDASVLTERARQQDYAAGKQIATPRPSPTV
jgi:hypothetical protein